MVKRKTDNQKTPCKKKLFDKFLTRAEDVNESTLVCLEDFYDIIKHADIVMIVND